MVVNHLLNGMILQVAAKVFESKAVCPKMKSGYPLPFPSIFEGAHLRFVLGSVPYNKFPIRSFSGRVFEGLKD